MNETKEERSTVQQWLVFLQLEDRLYFLYLTGVNHPNEADRNNFPGRVDQALLFPESVLHLEGIHPLSTVSTDIHTESLVRRLHDSGVDGGGG